MPIMHFDFNGDSPIVIRFASTSLAMTPEDATEAVIAGACSLAQIKQSLKQIFFSWPNLRIATTRCAILLSPRFPSKDDVAPPLLARTLVKAVEAYANARHHQVSEEAPPQAFLSALLDASVEVAAWDVHGLSGTSMRWEMGTESLTSFAERYREVVFAPHTPSAREIFGTRVVMMGRILSVTDASLMDAESVFHMHEPLLPPGRRQMGARLGPAVAQAA